MYCCKEDCCGTVSIQSDFLNSKLDSGIFFKCIKTCKLMCFNSSSQMIQNSCLSDSRADYLWWNISSSVSLRERGVKALNFQFKTDTWQTQPFTGIRFLLFSSFLLENICRAAVFRLAQLFCFHDFAKAFHFQLWELKQRAVLVICLQFFA